MHFCQINGHFVTQRCRFQRPLLVYANDLCDFTFNTELQRCALHYDACKIRLTLFTFCVIHTAVSHNERQLLL